MGWAPRTWTATPGCARPPPPSPQGELRQRRPARLYTDVDHADTFFLIGHNVAACQTVLWSRMLDRRRGPDPPALVVVDPRPTPTARDADLLDTVERSRDEVVAQLKWLRTRMKQAAPQVLVVAD